MGMVEGIANCSILSPFENQRERLPIPFSNLVGLFGGKLRAEILVFGGKGRRGDFGCLAGKCRTGLVPTSDDEQR